MFIALEGIDGAGKSTQAKRLADWLRQQGRSVVECADPGGTPFGLRLREILLNGPEKFGMTAEMLLFMASRAELVRQVIAPARAAGQFVVCDRFLLSNIVYQGHAGGLDPEVVRQVGEVASGGLKPDRVYLLDLPLDVSASRRKPRPDRLESRPAEFFQRVRAGFHREAQRDPERIRLVDARPSSDAVFAELVADLAGML